MAFSNSVFIFFNGGKTWFFHGSFQPRIIFVTCLTLSLVSWDRVIFNVLAAISETLLSSYLTPHRFIKTTVNIPNAVLHFISFFKQNLTQILCCLKEYTKTHICTRLSKINQTFKMAAKRREN